MLSCVLVGLIFVLGVVLLCLSKNKIALKIISIILIVASVGGTCFCGYLKYKYSSNPAQQIMKNDMWYDRCMEEYDIYNEYYDDYSDSMREAAMNDIIAYNRYVVKYKDGAASLWTNWFFNEDVADELEPFTYGDIPEAALDGKY